MKNVKAQYRLHRRRLATHLRQMSWDGLRGRIVESTAMIAKTSLRSDETTRLIDECNDERAARFVSLVELQVNMAAHEYFARKDRKDPIEALFAAHTELDEYLEEWVSDPDSVLSALETQNRERERGRKAMHDFLGLE